MEQILRGLSNNFLQNVCLTIGIIGILSGLDLILGAKIIIILKRVLDKSIDIDRTIINSKVKVGLGVIILILSSTILFLLTRITL